MTVEYTVLNEYGDPWDWSCGHPRVFNTVDALLAHNIEASDTIVRRQAATEWEAFVPGLGK